MLSEMSTRHESSVPDRWKTQVANSVPGDVQDFGKTGRIYGELDDFVARQTFDDGTAVTWTTPLSAQKFVAQCIQFTQNGGDGIRAYVRADGSETVVPGSDVLARLADDIQVPTRIKLVTDDYAETFVWTRAGASAPGAATAAVLEPKTSNLGRLGPEHLMKMMKRTGTSAADDVALNDAVQGSLGIIS